MSAAITTTATTLEGQVLEVMLALQALEVAQTTADNDLNRTTLAPDTEANEIALAVTLPVSLSGASGAITYTATEYLA